MNRRAFFKFLGIGAATAVVAPKVLADPVPEVYPESNAGQITLKMLQDAHAQAVIPPHYGNYSGAYMQVKLAPTSLPVYAGDIVFYKSDKRWGTLAYKRKKFTLWKGEETYGYGIGNLTPGNYGFIQIPNSLSYSVSDWNWERTRKRENSMSTQSTDRIFILEAELASLKQRRKEEARVAKIQSRWINAKKQLPDADTLRVLAWADGRMERCWAKDGKWYIYDGTFFLTEKDRIDNVTHWIARDWMYSREWPKYGPGVKNRLRYIWNMVVYGAQDMAYDLRPKGWGSKAQLDKKVTYYRDSTGKLMTGLPSSCLHRKATKRLSVEVSKKLSVIRLCNGVRKVMNTAGKWRKAEP